MKYVKGIALKDELLEVIYKKFIRTKASVVVMDFCANIRDSAN
jgi:hypothetical protein